jgi:hypothetical protein
MKQPRQGLRSQSWNTTHSTVEVLTIDRDPAMEQYQAGSLTGAVTS